MDLEMTFNDAKHDKIGSYKTKQEVQDDARYWRKGGYRARIVTSSFDDERPFYLYVSRSGRHRKF